MDKEGKEILAIFEHKIYPFMGWQFLLKKIQFEHNEDFNVNWSHESVFINGKFSQFFGEFLAFESTKINFNEVLEFRRGIYVQFLYKNNDESFFFPFLEINVGKEN